MIEFKAGNLRTATKIAEAWVNENATGPCSVRLWPNWHGMVSHMYTKMFIPGVPLPEWAGRYPQDKAKYQAGVRPEERESLKGVTR